MNQWPNIISASKGMAACGLLFTPAFSMPFWSLYGWCGISDMVDGPLARKLGAESRTGSIVDSVSDSMFVAAAAVKMLPQWHISGPLWVWMAAVALIRVSNIILGYVRQHRLVMLHTAANKLTGLLLFLLPAAMQTWGHPACVAAVCSVATFASAQEGISIWNGGRVPDGTGFKRRTAE